MEESKPKVIFILEDSERADWGAVKDCHGDTPEDLSGCEVIGTWSRIGEGTFYVELTTSVEAQQDVLIQLIKERAEARRLAWGDSPPTPGRMEAIDRDYSWVTSGESGPRKRAPRSTAQEVEATKEITREFGSLRDRLKRS